MVVIKENVFVRDNAFRKHTKKTGMCSSCSEELIFFDLAPITCCYCNKPLFNMNKLLLEQDYRIDYHFEVSNS